VVNSGKYKGSKHQNDSRNSISSAKSNSHSNRVANLNQYITMFSNVLPYGPRNGNIKHFGTKSNKKSKKVASRLNSSALSIYNDHSKSMTKAPMKEYINNVSLNSYSNAQFGLEQYKTLNTSIANSRDFEKYKIKDSRNRSRASKGRIKTTGTNSNIEADKLLEGMPSYEKSTLTGNNTNARSSIKATCTRSNDLMYNLGKIWV